MFKDNALLSNTTLWNFAHAIEDSLSNVLDKKKMESFKDLYLTNIGAYGFMNISEIENDQSITEEIKKIRIDKLKKFILEEFERINKEKFEPSTILYYLQEAEYDNRKMINRIRNGVE